MERVGEEVTGDGGATDEEDDTIGPNETITFWRELCCGGLLAHADISLIEFINFAEFIFIQMLRSCEDEIVLFHEVS